MRMQYEKALYCSSTVRKSFLSKLDNFPNYDQDGTIPRLVQMHVLKFVFKLKLLNLCCMFCTRLFSDQKGTCDHTTFVSQPSVPIIQ